MAKYLYILIIFSCIACKATPKKPMFYSYVKDTDRSILHGPVKQIKQFGTIDTTDGVARGNDKFKYYTASFVARRFDKGGSGFKQYDTLGMLTYRHSLKSSINQKFYDSLRKHRMYIYHYEYNKQDVAEKLKYKQPKEFPWFVHNPYRVKIMPNSYQAYKMKVEMDSSYKKISRRYDYKVDGKGMIIEEKKIWLIDYDLDGIIDKISPYYQANYIYNDNNQLITKQYTITDDNVLLKTIDIDDFEFESVPKSWNPVINYKWDDRGNLKEVTTQPDKARPTINHLEQYYYNDSNHLIKKRVLHPRGILRGINKHARDIHDLYFDERGNVVKVESINDDRTTVYATYLYDYSNYDEYGNWTLSNGYLDGDTTKKPNIVTKRIIEYYEKEIKE